MTERFAQLQHGNRSLSGQAEQGLVVFLIKVPGISGGRLAIVVSWLKVTLPKTKNALVAQATLSVTSPGFAEEMTCDALWITFKNSSMAKRLEDYRAHRSQPVDWRENLLNIACKEGAFFSNTCGMKNGRSSDKNC